MRELRLSVMTKRKSQPKGWLRSSGFLPETLI